MPSEKKTAKKTAKKETPAAKKAGRREPQNREVHTNLSREEQIIHGIEQLALAWRYVDLLNKKLNVSKFTDFITELNHTDPDNPEAPIPTGDKSRIYVNYRSTLQDEFKTININLQQGEVTWEPEKIISVYPLAEKYLKSIGGTFDANALSLLLNNISYTDSQVTKYEKGIKLPGLALYYIVVFHYAIKFRLPLKFNFREIMGKRTSERHILPLSLSCRNGYVDLIGVDLNDKNIVKQFILSCIEGIGSDLYDEFEKAKKHGFKTPFEFDYDEYKKTAEYHFQRPVHEYTIQMLGHTYNHFCHSYLIEHEIVKKNNDYDIIVKFKNSDWRAVAEILMNYAGYIHLLDEKIVPLDNIPEKTKKKISSDGDTEGYPKEKLPDNCGKNELPLMCRIRNQFEKLIKEK